MTTSIESFFECGCTFHDHAILHACLSLYAARLPLFHTLLHWSGGSSADVWNMPRATLARFRLRTATIDALLQGKTDFDIANAARELQKYAALGMHMICRQDTRYPELLAAIAQPPAALYVRGNSALLAEHGRHTIAVVGTRRPSAYGVAVARQAAARSAALGWCVVSGLALGIDAIAHDAVVQQTQERSHSSAASSAESPNVMDNDHESARGTLLGGTQQIAPTIAVLGSGLADSVIGPASNQPLARAILQHGGLLLSEYPFTVPVQARFFPERNRIIAGLSQVTLVVEAARNSGSLITSRHALEENRDVFAVPGEIYNPLAYGPNILIARGATPVASLDDLAAELLARSNAFAHALTNNPLAHDAPTADLPDASIAHLTQTQQQVLRDGIGHKTASAHIATIQERTNLPADLLAQELVLLEIEGLIAREHTGEYRWL